MQQYYKYRKMCSLLFKYFLINEKSVVEKIDGSFRKCHPHGTMVILHFPRRYGMEFKREIVEEKSKEPFCLHSRLLRLRFHSRRLLSRKVTLVPSFEIHSYSHPNWCFFFSLSPSSSLRRRSIVGSKHTERHGVRRSFFIGS